MTNPAIANQNRRRAASWSVFKLGITMEYRLVSGHI